MHDRLISQLHAIVGRKHLTTEPVEMEPYLLDWRGNRAGDALAVVRPGSVEEVSAVVKAAADVGAAIVPQGGRTGLTGASLPEAGRPGLILSLSRMAQIRRIDPVSLVAEVEAGCTVGALRAACDAAGCDFPLSFGAMGSATVGGVIGTNAGGSAALRYGNTRDLILGVEAVAGSGHILERLSGLRKDNRGIDAKHLFIGTEGAIGVVTAATVKLVPKARQVSTSLIAADKPDALLDAFLGFRSAFPENLTAFELMNGADLSFVKEMGLSAGPEVNGTHLGLVEISTASDMIELHPMFEHILSQLFETGSIIDGVLAASEQQRSDIWRVRESLPETARVARTCLILDYAVEPAAMFDLEHRLKTYLAEETDACLTYGHLGDGNLHVNLCWSDRDVSEEVQMSIKAACNGIVLGMGGTFSAEHGIGREKRRELAAWLSDSELETCLQIMRLADPKNTLNPGVLY